MTFKAKIAAIILSLVIAAFPFAFFILIGSKPLALITGLCTLGFSLDVCFRGKNE